MATMKKTEPFRWRGMNLFTRALWFFLIGAGFLLLRDHLPSSMIASVVTIIGYGFYLVGFVIASLGMGHHWRDTVLKEIMDKNKEERKTR